MCYISNMYFPFVEVTLLDTFPILKAERAASTVARLLDSTAVELERVYTAKGARYGCKVKHVHYKELEQWQI